MHEEPIHNSTHSAGVFLAFPDAPCNREAFLNVLEHAASLASNDGYPDGILASPDFIGVFRTSRDGNDFSLEGMAYEVVATNLAFDWPTKALNYWNFMEQVRESVMRLVETCDTQKAARHKLEQVVADLNPIGRLRPQTGVIVGN